MSGTGTPPPFGDAEYAGALAKLMPRGRIWRGDPGSNLQALLASLAPTYTRSTQAAAQVLVDADPATTVNLLDEWEASLGLPDPCTAPSPSLQQRRAAVRAKFGARGTLNIPFFIRLAASLGFTVTITEFMSYRADMACDLPDYDAAWDWAWEVTAPQVTTFYFSADQSNADDPLETYDNSELACRMLAYAPAGTILFFAFS